tara:strand:+ start:67 stop:591 length:525 start_codon:yes stop_codon:yes gene_type:complete
MKNILIIILFSWLFTISCSKVRESAGVNRKNIDEFQVVENPPLIIPPDFNLLPPEQLSEKDIENVEDDLAKEILFGLNEENAENNEELSTMDNILNQTKAKLTDNSIRKEINEQFASEKETNPKNFNDKAEILDSIKESERLRNQLLNNSDESEEIPKVEIEVKKKKKKRFFFF